MRKTQSKRSCHKETEESWMKMSHLEDTAGFLENLSHEKICELSSAQFHMAGLEINSNLMLDFTNDYINYMPRLTDS